MSIKKLLVVTFTFSLIYFPNIACQKNKTEAGKKTIPQLNVIVNTYPNEPDGFRDVKWGKDISQLKEFRKAKRDFFADSVMKYLSDNIYVRKNEKLSFGNTKVDRIRYHSFHGKLVAVVIQGKHQDTFLILKDALFQKYGSPQKTEEPTEISPIERKGIESYEWTGEKTNIKLSYIHETIDELFSRIEIAHEKLGFKKMTLVFEDAKHVLMVKMAREEYQKEKAAGEASKAAKDF